MSSFADEILEGIPSTLPAPPIEDPAVNHAPVRPRCLDAAGAKLALRNALRYVPKAWHGELAPEFADELQRYGRIYMQRFRPRHAIRARAIDAYPARCREAAALMLMIQNNLDPAVAQHPHELITYGGNGTVFQNWAQYRITMQLLCQMSREQTLVLYSGHPLGLFPSHPGAPRLVLTCGMVIPNYSSREDYDRLAALGVSSYGQMTAGSFMYIGPQGIVHGTTITLLNAGRRYLGLAPDQKLHGKVFVSSGLGGMSGAQAKAAVIAGAVGVIAEINPKPLQLRHEQGWLDEVESDLDKLVKRIETAVKAREAVSIGYLGNIVELWERLARDGVQVDLGSDQTSLHNPYLGGYYPAGLSFDQAQQMMSTAPDEFRNAVQSSLRRQVAAVNTLAKRGMAFWDYGNAFLLEASRAGAEGILNPDGSFAYPSYVEDIMGPLCFDYGFGPFRWVCTSGDDEDLRTTDAIAASVLEKMLEEVPEQVQQQTRDNLDWIRAAESNKLVVGSRARILYADREGRMRIAEAFNQAIAKGELKAAVVLGRDHHDVSGTDSPFRETANIKDGSRFCADMAVHNVIGDAFRGATWVSLHNGGGVGWGEVINGGFGLVLDGSAEASERARNMLSWDVGNGLARRAWARNPGAIFAAQRAMQQDPRFHIVLPELAEDALLASALGEQS
ncbi:MAG: urocanate hydratase [Myxococcota bacterium]|jgi:urocanate hydratase|nr:urocanate hydratase [Myxococcota bacterium]